MTTSDVGGGCEANPTGNPIGGGEGYEPIFTCGDFTVTSKRELLDALQQAQPGQVIFFPDGVEIDLTGTDRVPLPGSVTLAGTRGRGGSAGARLFTSDLTVTQFVTTGEHARITGLRLEGSYEGTERTPHTATGLQTTHFRTEVDNCEVCNWSTQGIWAGGGSSQLHVHHSSIHHCQRDGKGYGVVLYSADARIIANFFEYCRHAIAGGGQPGTSYEAAWNLFSGKTNGHTVNMHGGRDIGDGTDTAGDYVHIHHNTFTPGNYFPEIVIRGTPAQGCKIHSNWFEREPDRDMWLFGGNSRAWDNIYEPDRKRQKAVIEAPNRTVDAEGRVVPVPQQRN